MRDCDTLMIDAHHGIFVVMTYHSKEKKRISASPFLIFELINFASQVRFPLYFPSFHAMFSFSDFF
jgi:hypothetical protein